MNKIKSTVILILSFTVIACIVCFFSSKYLDTRINDFFIKLITTKPANEDTVIVIIDDKSIAKIRWPWKRTLYADVFDFVHKTSKAKMVVWDALLVSPDNLNPKSDREFFRRVKYFDNMIGGFDIHTQSEENIILPNSLIPLFESKFSDINIKDEKNKSKTMYSFKGVTNFLPQYLKSISSLGAISVFIDYDGVLRVYSPLVKINDKLYPSLPLVIHSKITGTKNYEIKNNYFCSDDDCQTLKIPITNDIKAVTKWYKPYEESSHYSHKKYSAIDVLESYRLTKEGKKPIIDPNEFKDKIVIVGAAANTHAIEDIKNTPILPRQFGSDVVATFIDNLLNNEFMTKTSTIQNIIILGILSIISFLLILNYSMIISSIACVCAFLGYFLIYLNLIQNDVIIPIGTAFLIQVIAMLFGYSYRFIIEDTKKKKIQHAMGMYLSNDVMKNVVKNIDDVKLGGKRAELTVLFADIRGFTSISEKLQPEEVTNILNEYFSEMEPIISKYKGVLNKFIGDAVLVVFGDPIYDKDHALNAVKCASHMLKRVKYLQEKWIQEGKPKIEIGVGINTGEAFVGNIGSQNRLEYTVIGDSVNLASRIEGYNKVYKTKFLISHSTYSKVRKYVDVIQIKDVTIRGKAKKIDIYEVLRMNEE